MFGLQMGRMGSVGGQMTDLARILALPSMGPLWDFSDMSTMFQDSAGTQPVTAFGQPVGLMLDKSKGLVRGPELVTNGWFDDVIAGWSPGAASIALVNGELEVTAEGATGQADIPVSTVIGRLYSITGDGYRKQPSGFCNLTVDAILDGTSTAPSTLTALTGFYFVAISSITVIRIRVTLAVVGDKFAFDNISVREIPGVHLVQPTAINRPIYVLDANGKPSLSFNGTNQWLKTSVNLDLSGTDKVTIAVGIRKQSASTAIPFESEGTFNGVDGGYGLILNDASPSDYFGYRGTGVGALIGKFNGGVAPASSVLVAQLDSAAGSNAAQLSTRRNAADATPAYAGSLTAPATFKNRLLFVGSRAGVSGFLNGNLHTLAIRAALSTQPEIDLLERFANSRAGAY